MAEAILSDELWQIIEPFLPRPKKRRFRSPGRKPIGRREALTGMLFVLKTSLPWRFLPLEMGCGSGVPCWRRLRDWHRRGVWKKLHEVLLARLNGADKLDWSRASVDSASVRAIKGGRRPGPTRRIARRQARSTTSSPPRMESRSLAG